MDKHSHSSGSVADYIAQFPPAVRSRLKAIRKIVRACAPDAREKLSYGMPGYKLNGILLYFAGHSNHIGFYPLTTAVRAFQKELKIYHASKGTVQFPHDRPLPVALIRKMVKFRVKENRSKIPAAKNRS